MSDLSYANERSDIPLIGLTIGEQVEAAAVRYPDHDAMVDMPSGRRWTYRQLNDAVDSLATGLLRLGVEKGDRVGIWAPNVPEWVLIQYATAKVGAILVTLNPGYRKSELTYALRQAGISMLVAASRFKSSDYAAMVAEVREDVPNLRKVVMLGSTEWLDLAATPIDADSVRGRMAQLNPTDPINIQYTSGTTGFPKGATLTHHNILNNGFWVTEVQRFTADDRVCVQVPFYHCFGMVMANLGALTHGACIVLPSPSYDAAASLRAIEAESCTALYGVPTMFIGMLEHPTFDSSTLTSLRTGVMAGSPCPIEYMKRVVSEMNLRDITIAYGMTETSPISTHTRLDASFERRTTTVGTVLPHLEVKIVDPVTGATMPRGVSGEFCTRGYSVMRGYWNQPDKTAEAIDADGWMHSGDLATMDSEGYINIVGRLKDMVIRGGENLFPREIEEFLYTHPDIADVQVVGVPDPRLGEELCAWIRVKDGRPPITEERLREFCKGKLAHFKVPRYVHIAAEFPMTANGKIRKTEMREQSIRELGLDDSIVTA
ncbi:AMP-binding protein [Arthrobacter sp. EpRS71]|uniref:AMP-binding protein n=1 Tax=Arthrobacter sp. EpRS71 TaxID=1743141 RepID=UPI00074A5DB5|nr:AMP-binding protein [Arthrobacter sp. EpRS71]KUM42209.1 AMP-binding protein [Arthrobacter sp. EpRS71]